MQETWDLSSIPGSGRSPGGGHGTPLQYSCLENSMDRGAWRATVYRVTKSRTQLKQFSTHSTHTLARSLEIIILASLCILLAVFYLPLKPRALNLTPVSLILLTLRSALRSLTCVLVTQSCLTLCKPMDHSPPGSSLHGILQARILEWVAISFSRGSSQPKDWTQVSCTAGRCLTIWLIREAQKSYRHLQLHMSKNRFFFCPNSSISINGNLEFSICSAPKPWHHSLFLSFSHSSHLIH